MTMFVTWIPPLRSLAACVLALALTPAVAYAQRPGGGKQSPADRSMRRQERRDAKQDIRREMNGRRADGRSGGGPERRAPLGRGAFIGRALGLLTLSPEQRRTLRQIRARSDERMRQHGRRVLDLRRDIDASLFGRGLALDVAKSKGRELAAIIGERTTERTNVEIAVFESLTTAQRTEVRAMRDAQREKVREAFRERAMNSQNRPPVDDVESGDEPPEGDELEALADEPPAGVAPGGRADADRPRARRQGGMPEMLAGLGVTPDQVRRLRQLRRQQGTSTRQAAVRFRDIQAEVDELLLADALESARLRELALQLGRADAERELVRLESEAGIREILTAEQAAAFRERRRRQWNEERKDEPQPPEPRPEPPRAP